MRRLHSLISFAFILSLIVSACKPKPTATPMPEASPTPLPAVNPTVADHFPARGDELKVDGSIDVYFDQPMDRASVESAFSIQPSVAGAFQWLDDASLRFTPSAPLERASRYVITIGAGAKSARGLPFTQPYSFEAQTVGFLEVAQVIPADGVTDAAVDSLITVIFNRPVVPLTVGADQASLPNPLTLTPAASGRGEWLNTSIFVFRPDVALAGGTTYRADVAAGLTDAAGGLLRDSYSWSFTTLTPDVVSVVPAPGEVDIGLTQPISVTFNQPMDHAVTERAFSLTADGERISGTFDWDDETNTLGFRPSERLALSRLYTVQVDQSATAAGGGATLAQSFDSSFTTVAYPAVVRTSPFDGDSQADPYGGFSVYFSAPMDEATLQNNVTILPEATAAYTYWSSYDKSFFLSWNLKPSTEYTVTLGPAMADPYGNRVGQETTVKFTTRPLEPQAYLNAAGNVGTYSAYTDTLVYATTINVSLLQFRLYSLDLLDFAGLTGPESYDFRRTFSPANLIREWEVRIESPLNESYLTPISLVGADGQRLGPGLYYLTMNSPDLSDLADEQYHLMVVSGANLTVKAALREALVWATDLQSGQPLANLPMAIYDQDFDKVAEGATDAEGLFRADLPRLPDLWTTVYAVSQGGPGLDSFSVGLSDWSQGVEPWDFNVPSAYYAQDYQVYLYTDRPVYRPGQTVYFKAVVRRDDDAKLTLPDIRELPIRIYNDQYEQVLTQTLTLTPFGTAWGEFKLSESAGLGFYTLQSSLEGGEGSLGFQVAEYRKPEFQVTASTDKAEYAQGENIQFSAQAQFFFGGAVSDAAVHWSLLSAPYYYDRYPGQGYWEFTDFDSSAGEAGPFFGAAGELIAEGDGQTDAQGNFSVSIPAALGKKTTSQTFTLEATVTDVNGQSVSGRTAVIVHQGLYYIGLRPEVYVGQAGQPQKINLVTAGWQGEAAPNQTLTVVANKHDWHCAQESDEMGNKVWTCEVEDTPVFTDTVRTGADGLGVFTFTPELGGTYKILATGRDARGNTVRASTIVWISSREYITWRQENNQRITLVADRKSYQPGETAEILIPSPFQGAATALITVERGRILTTDVVQLSTNSTVYRVPIQPDFAPNVFVSAVIVKGVDETSPYADFRLGVTELQVSLEQKEIKVTLTPDKERVGPRETVTYRVRATDFSGRPVQAEFSLGVADLAALSLADPNAPPILSALYGDRGWGVRTGTGLALSVNRFTVQTARAKGGGGGGAEVGFVEIRGEFLDTAYWSAAVVTDANGEASVSVTLPDNLTTWRLDARGVGGASGPALVGQATVDIVATKDLLIRPVTPRFFVVGDSLQLAAVVNNNTDADLNVDVTLSGSGLSLASDARQSTLVKAHDRAQVTWMATVSDAPAADLTFSVTGGGLADASKPPLGTPPDQLIPILKYSAPQTVGTAGQLVGAKSIVEAIALPRRFDATQGQLAVHLDPSLAAGMTAGLRYLEHYPFECTEQTVSRFLPNVLTYSALKTLGLSDPALEARLSGLVSEGLQKLYAQQHFDGGWGWFSADQSDAYVSAYVLFGLSRAQAAGFDVSANVVEKAVNFVAGQLQNPRSLEAAWQVNRQAFLLYALAEAGAGDISRTNQLYDVRQRLDAYAQAYLALAMHLLAPGDPRIPALLSDLNNAALLSATGAHWEEKGQVDWWNMNTDTRSTAVILDALARLHPEDNLIPNVVRWLMTARQASGAWETTQETAWALIGLTDWMAHSGELNPRYAYVVSLNGERLGDGTATANNVRESSELVVAVADLLTEQANQLTIERNEGDGALYYTAHLTVYQNVADVKSLSRGLVVARQYTLPGQDCGGPRQPACPAITSASAGQDVQVRLTIVAPTDLYYVVIEDPFPAGMEAVDTSLKTTSVVGQAPQLDYADPFRGGWGWWWFSDADLRDEKLVLSASHLPKGTYEYTYSLHASLPGTYNVIPPTGSEFYFPEVFGRGDGMVFTVRP